MAKFSQGNMHGWGTVLRGKYKQERGVCARCKIVGWYVPGEEVSSAGGGRKFEGMGLCCSTRRLACCRLSHRF